jgi:hypothetical protein
LKKYLKIFLGLPRISLRPVTAGFWGTLGFFENIFKKSENNAKKGL